METKNILLGALVVGGLLALSSSSEGQMTPEDFFPEDFDETGEPAPLAPPEADPQQIPSPAAPSGRNGNDLYQAALRYVGYRYPACVERGETTDSAGGRRTVCLKREDPNGSTGALDCSGLIWRPATDLGVSIERRASMQQTQVQPVDEATARQTPGALVFFWNKNKAGQPGVFHVEMSSGEGQVLGSRTTTGVRLRPWADWNGWKAAYRPDFVTYGVLPQFSSPRLSGWMDQAYVFAPLPYVLAPTLQGWMPQAYVITDDTRLVSYGGGWYGYL